MKKRRKVRGGKGPEPPSPLDINLSALDRELQLQPKRYKKWADHATNARNRVNEAKRVLDLVKAQLSLKIRKLPQKFGIDKVTEPVIESAVTAHQTYQEAVKDLNQAKYELDQHENMVSALEHKKPSLGKLVDLWLASYFADPKIDSARNRQLVHEADKRAARRPVRR